MIPKTTIKKQKELSKKEIDFMTNVRRRA